MLAISLFLWGKKECSPASFPGESVITPPSNPLHDLTHDLIGDLRRGLIYITRLGILKRRLSLMIYYTWEVSFSTTLRSDVTVFLRVVSDRQEARDIKIWCDCCSGGSCLTGRKRRSGGKILQNVSSKSYFNCCHRASKGSWGNGNFNRGISCIDRAVGCHWGGETEGGR